MKVYIYTLEDPRTQEVRYVGKTKNPKGRFHNHCNKLHNERSHKRNWINSLKVLGLRPKMRIIEEVEQNEWHFWEKYWIEQFKQWGFNLVNHTLGGDGLTTSNQTSFKKGNIPWNKGIIKERLCPECNQLFKPTYNNSKQIYCSYKCTGKNRISNTRFEKGHISWNKDVKGYSTTKSKKKVYQYCAYTGDFIKEWLSSKEASLSLNINNEGIGNCCRLICKSTGGYMWRYNKEEKIEIMNNVKLKIKKIC